MDSIAEQAVCAAAAGEMPQFADGSINLQELFRQLAESVINAVMDAEAEEMCSASGNSRRGGDVRDRREHEEGLEDSRADGPREALEGRDE